ncbi:MAG: RIP metalloprotease RseP [Geminicoccaceae bacterium]
MEFISWLGLYVVPFLIILSVVVFVHEWGHYWVARRNGVRVEVFSIGFGSEIFGFNDADGTRWKFSAVPLGGYVKMLGDADAASATIDLSKANDAESFPSKSVYQRMAIVFAGPAANFVFAILVMALLFMVQGRPQLTAEVGGVRADSPAAAAGLLPEDVIVAINGEAVEQFEELRQAVAEAGTAELMLTVERDGGILDIGVTPALPLDDNGQPVEGATPVIGVEAGEVAFQRSNPLIAPVEATIESGRMVVAILGAVGEIITGQRSAKELGGPIRIAQLSGEAAQGGVSSMVWLTVVLSINLGLINLFPIPMLDGGHLVMYGIEATRGKPLTERSQEIAFRFGLAMILGLMVFVTWNDLVYLRVVEFFTGLGS